MKIHYSHWLLKFFPKWVLAFTFGDHVFCRYGQISKRIACHELCHVIQYRNHGIVGFLWIYFVKDFFKSYRRKRFEVTAYNCESERKLKTQWPTHTSFIDESLQQITV